MSLRTKIVIILLVVVGLYAVSGYGIQHLIILPSFISLEHSEAQKDMERCIQTLNREIHHLDVLTHDWGAWDDTYEFVKDRNDDYTSSNMTITSWAENNLNIIYICDLKGRVVSGQIYDIDTVEPITIKEFPADSLPESHPLLRHKTVESFTAGVLQTEKGPMLVSSRPIVTSDKEGPIRGTIIMGRFLNDTIEQLAEQMRVDLKLQPIADSSISAEERDILKYITAESPFYIHELDDKLLQVYAVIYDAQTSPALLMRADVPRDISAKAAIAIYFALSSIFIACLIILLSLLVLLRKTVIAPITKLTGHAMAIGKSDDMSARLSMQSKDEIGILAQEFDRMVEKLADTRNKLLEQSYQSGIADMASGTLHNVRNALGPMVSDIERLRQNLDEAPTDKIKKAEVELADENLSDQRKIDLIKFMDLANRSLTDLVQNTHSKLYDIVKQVSSIEEILADQDKFSHAEHPLEKIKLDELINDSIALTTKSAEEISIEMDPCIETTEPVMAHRVVLLQIFSNILDNAKKSVRRAGTIDGKISIETHVEKSDGVDVVHVRIKDNGQGIEAGDLERIFERGFSTVENGYSGTGLHWCANAISTMKGQIYAESEGTGHGACFHILLRCSKESSEVFAE